jgi:DNA-binding NtrC family response regulator
MIVRMTATVLIVEDDDDVRELAATVMREASHRVLQAMNGGIALVMLEQRLPIDVLFTDIVMPGEPDGFALAEEAVRLRPGIKVLYTTGYTGLARYRTIQPRLYGKILQKPYLPHQLTAEIEALLAHS